MKIDSLDKLYLHELKDLYNAEAQILKALPKMAKAATSSKLADAFKEHVAETRVHIERLERIFNDMGVPAKGSKCEAMAGLVREAQGTMEEDMDPEVLDAALIGSAQRVEHYEMAGYGCARTYAKLLGRDNDARLLQETLDEEGATDKKLTKLATSVINLRAMA